MFAVALIYSGGDDEAEVVLGPMDGVTFSNNLVYRGQKLIGGRRFLGTGRFAMKCELHPNCEMFGGPRLADAAVEWVAKGVPPPPLVSLDRMAELASQHRRLIPK